MKNNRLVKFCIGSLSVVVLTQTTIQPGEAGQNRFFCASQNGVWTTFVKSPKGNVPLIRWTSGDFTESGWTNEKRCQAVSSRFQAYNQKGQLNHIKNGVINRHPVLCAVSSQGSHCSDKNVLVTLKAGTDGKKTLEQLLDIRRGVKSKPINLSGDQEDSQADYEELKRKIIVEVDGTVAVDVGQLIDVLPTVSDDEIENQTEETQAIEEPIAPPTTSETAEPLF